MKCIIREGYSIHYLGRDLLNKDGVIDIPDEMYKKKLHIFEPQEFVDSKIEGKVKSKVEIVDKDIIEEKVTNRAIPTGFGKRRER